MFTAALFTIGKTWKQPKCSSVDEWLFTHKKNEILPFTITWMDLEGVMLSEISQAEKDKYCVVSFICGI